MQTTVNLKISSESKQWLETTATQTDRTVSAIVRAAIEFYRRGYHYAFSFPEKVSEAALGTSTTRLTEVNAELIKALEALNKVTDEYLESKRA
jgi:hypothetical protein